MSADIPPEAHMGLNHKSLSKSQMPPHSKMTPPRRAIACTTCAKAKTKCDKAVPSCSRCTAKGLQCEPRSTRRTSDNSYRQSKKQHVTPKRFPSTSSLSSVRRETSSRNIPTSAARSQTIDTPSSAGVLPGQPQLSGLPVLTPLQTFGSGPMNERFPEYDSTDANLSCTPPMDNGAFHMPGHFTPQTPDSYTSQEDHVPIMADPFDQYMNPHLWADDNQMPVGLGFDTEMPGISPSDVEMKPFWSEVDSEFLTMPPAHLQDSPLSDSPSPLTAWPTSVPAIPSAAPAHTMHTRSVPSLSMSDYSASELDVVTTIREDWPAFRCNPSDAHLPRPVTSRTYLEGLRAIPKASSTWTDAIAPVHRLEGALNSVLSVEHIQDQTRDAIMTTMKELLYRARIAHEACASPRSTTGSPDAVDFDEGLLSCPSSAALESLFRAYNARFELHYPNFPEHNLDAKELLQSDASKLLMVLMLAAGASATPTTEASCLTNGLVESCRILLGDLADNDLALWKDPLFLRAALLSINLAAWTGQKWHMDVAKSQSDLFFKMLRRSGLFAYRENPLPEFDGLVGTEIAWKQWKQSESLNRLAYSSVIIDQEFSLFSDKATNFSITELTAALPDKDVLWQASSADSWSLALASVHNSNDISSGQTPPSLYDLYKRLTNGELVEEGLCPTKLHLRLLLHPIQALVHHLHQCLGCFAGDASSGQAQSLFFQIREVQCTLQDWFALCTKLLETEDPTCPVLLTNQIMYHLIYLNTMTHFPDVEAFARGEVSHQQFLNTSWARTNSVGSAPQIWYHCGQLIRLIRMMPEANCPRSIPAVIYRVCLLLWSTGTMSPSAKSTQSPTPFSDSMFAIDNMHPEHASLVRYLRLNEGTPMLSTRKGVLISPTAPADMITYCLEVMKEEELNTHFAKGIQARLETFANRVRSGGNATMAFSNDTPSFFYSA